MCYEQLCDGCNLGQNAGVELELRLKAQFTPMQTKGLHLSGSKYTLAALWNEDFNCRWLWKHTDMNLQALKCFPGAVLVSPTYVLLVQWHSVQDFA